jgi:hypothetical protein
MLDTMNGIEFFYVDWALFAFTTDEMEDAEDSTFIGHELNKVHLDPNVTPCYQMTAIHIAVY